MIEIKNSYNLINNYICGLGIGFLNIKEIVKKY